MELVFRYHAKFNKNNSKYKFWQASNQPKAMLNPKFIAQKINYIHNNPVAAEIVRSPEDYKYSSAAAYMGLDDNLLEVSVLDFGCEEGFVLT